ncbi:MAG: response regulator [Cypionkella sp.]
MSFAQAWPELRPAGEDAILAKPITRVRGRALGEVLLVEDDPLIALALEDALRDAGARDVTICRTTAEALAALRERKPDAMVIDVHLADRDDGWAIAELVSSVGPKPPRIVFSTGAPQDIPAEIAELGPVLEKPYNYAELVEALRRPPRAGLLSRIKGALT